MVLSEPLQPKFVGDPLPAALNEERDAINLLDEAVEERIPFPTGAATGDLLRWDGTAWVTTETRFLEGEGRPEGQVAAPVGSRYIDKTGEAGGVEWVKAIGDTNTGWITMAGDTGMRNVASMVNKRTTAVVDAALLRRIGNTVSLYLDLTMPNNENSPWDVLTLPVGFRPDSTRYGLMQDNREGAATGTSVTSSGVVNLYLIQKTKRDRFNGVWTTDDPWPAAFPGSAA
jgi:hypothetical protein